MRLLPELTAENTPYWTGGARGVLLIAQCESCAHAIHPPQLICPKCLSRDIAHRPALGIGTVHSFTINHQPWLPGMVVPYALVLVDLDGLPGVRITAELVADTARDVAIGQRVRVGFLHEDDVWIPQFHHED